MRASYRRQKNKIRKPKDGKMKKELEQKLFLYIVNNLIYMKLKFQKNYV